MHRDQIHTELSQALAQAEEWEIITESGVSYYIPVVPDADELGARRYLLEDFALIDQRLPAVIIDIINRLNEYRPPADRAVSFINSYLNNALLFWKGDHLILPVDSVVPLLTQEQHVQEIIDIDFNAEKRYLYIEYEAYDVVSTKNGLTYSCRIDHNCRRLRASWLDAHHPNWENQFLTAQTLDACLVDTFVHVMTRPVCAASMVPPSDIGP